MNINDIHEFSDGSELYASEEGKRYQSDVNVISKECKSYSPLVFEDNPPKKNKINK